MSRYHKSKHFLLEDKSIVKSNRAIFGEFLAWEEEKLKRLNNLSTLDESAYKTLYGYINKLRNVNIWFSNKSWKELTTSDIRKVYNDLEDGKIKNRAGKRFEDRSGYYNKIFKSKPFQLAGLQDKAEEALEFFTNKKKKEVRFISQETFLRMAGFLAKPQHKALFWLAWDIGENITSLLELKVKHLRRQINRDTREPEYLIYLEQETLKRSRQTRSEPTVYPETVGFLDALLKYGKETEFRDSKGHIKRKAIPFNEEDFLFSFKYRQALQIFNSVAKRSVAKCEPAGEKPSWKDLRSGMACHLFGKGWHVEDINLRLGHSPQSKWLSAYVNYLAVNRKRTIKKHFDSSLQDVQHELQESKLREKLMVQRLERLSQEITESKQELESFKRGEGLLKTILELTKKQKEMDATLENLTGKKFDIVLTSP